MKRRLATALLGLIAAAACSTAEAGGGWHVDFSYGAPGFHHHHWHGPCWYPRPSYGFVYVAPPPPVVYAAPAVVTVPAVTAVQAAPAPTASQPAVATTVRANPTPATRTAGVTLRNPAASGTNIAFVVDSRKEIELAPGEAMPLSDKNAYFIEFDRGGDFGTSKRTLTEGTYEFVGTENGWDLQRADEVDPVATPVATPVVRRNNLPLVK